MGDFWEYNYVFLNSLLNLSSFSSWIFLMQNKKIRLYFRWNFQGFWNIFWLKQYLQLPCLTQKIEVFFNRCKNKHCKNSISLILEILK